MNERLSNMMSLPCILLVDDEPTARAVLGAMLADERYHLAAAECGEQALALAEQLQPDLILLDIMMPDMDGYAVCRRLRATPALGEIPIVMLTALDDAASRLVGIEAGADDFLSKPVERTELRARVATILRLDRYRKLVAEKQRFVRLTDRLPHGVVLVDAEGQIRFANPAFIALVSGTTEDAAQARSILDWISPNDRESLQLAIDRLRHEGDAFRHLEVHMVRTDGTDFPAMLDGVSYSEAARTMVQLVVQDITDSVLLNTERAEVARRKDEFLALLAHELRNPLAPIGTVLDALRLTGFTESQFPQFHGILERQFKQLVRLVDDLMDMSRISRGDIRIVKSPCDLNVVLDQALETSQPQIRAGRHKVVVMRSAEPLFIDGDAVRLTQVFSNLLNNAAKYMAVGGTIEVTMESRENLAQISVHDQGIGIPAEGLPHLFEPFRRVGKAADDFRQPGGLGLGLSLVQRLVELHGGQVTAHSDGLGRGSVFRVDLPLSARAVFRVCPERETSSRPLSGRWILVVDDNRDAAETLALMLQQLGGTVKVAYDGPEALALCLTFTPDAVLLDLGMPGMDGYEVARRLRASPAGQTLELIAISGWGQEEDRRRSAAAGFDQHLVKPVSLQGILSCLDSPVSIA